MKKVKRNKMGKFNYKKWVTENKYGKLDEQGVADFKEEKEDKKDTKDEGAQNAGQTGKSEERVKAKKDNKSESKKEDKEDTKSESKKEDKEDTKSESKKEDKKDDKDDKDGGLENPKKADLNKDGKLSDYEKTRGAAIEKNMKEYKAGRTQINGNPLLPEQIFGMQHSSKPPKQEVVDEMMSYYEQMGCGGIQEMYKEYYYENKKLMSEMNNTGPYEGSNIMQEGDNPEKQGRLVAMMNYLSELAPTGCNEMAKIQEINGNFNLHENKSKISKKITKSRLKKIIKEELKNSFLKETHVPSIPHGGGFGPGGIPTKPVNNSPGKRSDDEGEKERERRKREGNVYEQTATECQQIQAIPNFMMCCENTNQWTQPMNQWSSACKTAYGQASQISSGYAECCSFSGTSTGTGTSNEGCKDPEIGRQCWYCKSPTSTPGCIQVMNGNIPWSNPFPLPLYMNQQDCMDAEGCPEDDTGTGTGTGTGDMLKCNCCEGGFPVGMSPIPASTPGGCSSLNGGGFSGCTSGIPMCKKIPSNDLPSGEVPMMAKKADSDLEKSRELREAINKEFFKK